MIMKPDIMDKFLTSTRILNLERGKAFNVYHEASTYHGLEATLEVIVHIETMCRMFTNQVQLI